MLSTGMSPSTGNTRFAIPCSQLAVVLLFRQRARFASNVFAAASRKVGALVRRLSASGSPPRRASRRFSNARSRASASVTSGQPPKPMSRRVPLTVSRWIQDFDPRGATRRYSVPPSPFRPGIDSAFSFATVSAPILSPRINQRSIGEPTGIERNCQACKILTGNELAGFSGSYGKAGKREVVPRARIELATP